MNKQDAVNMANALEVFAEVCGAWKGSDRSLFWAIEPYIDPECAPGMWKTDCDRFCAYLADGNLNAALSARSITLWRGEDQLIRLVNVRLPCGHEGERAYNFVTRPRKLGAVCLHCEIEEESSYGLEQETVKGRPGFVHPHCKYAWVRWNAKASEFASQGKLAEATEVSAAA